MKDKKSTEFENIKIIKRKDGTSYAVRLDRKRYFFPEEWKKFINKVTNERHKFFFETLLFTGGRIMEVLNLQYEDIDEDKMTIKFKVVKQRKVNKNYYSTGKSRMFFVSDNFIKKYKFFIQSKKINLKDYIFLDNHHLPKNYSELSNLDRKKYFNSKFISYSVMFKRKLRKAKIDDWYNFSPHNIRKTYGMWMRTYDKEMAELCYRMGHDIDTYTTHYGSSLIFTDMERKEINEIIGNVK